jgi:DNA-binding CsgD family transcriptional regulator
VYQHNLVDVAASPPIEDVTVDRGVDRVSAEYALRQHLSKGILTGSELTVINLIAQARPTRDVAQQLHLSPYTVKTHLHNAFAKLGITSRAQLARSSCAALSGQSVKYQGTSPYTDPALKIIPLSMFTGGTSAANVVIELWIAATATAQPGTGTGNRTTTQTN